MTTSPNQPKNMDMLRYSNEESNRITREAIETAFVAILAEKEIDQMTISEIVRKAGVSRSAFYRNYETKEGILEALTTKHLFILEQFVQATLIRQQAATFYEDIFDQIREEHYFFKLLLKARILEKSSEKIRHFIDTSFSTSPRQVRYLLFAWAGTMLHLIQKWYDEGMVESSQDMAQLCYSLFIKFSEEIKLFQADFFVSKP